jgi:hypothetical protein
VGDVAAETESGIRIAQGLAQQTKSYATKVFTTGTDIKCRICKQYEEAVYHSVG